MRDPLDEANPYLAEYAEWDLWCYRNARNQDDEELQAYYEDNLPEDYEVVSASVDSDGWMMPMLSDYAMWLEYKLGYYDTRAMEDCAGSMSCIGPMDPGTKERAMRELCKLIAPYCLPIPKWLADNPPVAAMHLPDGRYALLGDPGSGTDPTSYKLYADDMVDEKYAWAVYSSEGELEMTGNPGEHWWQLFYTDFEERTGYVVDDLSCHIWQGKISCYSFEGEGWNTTFSWDGRELEDSIDDDGWGMTYFYSKDLEEAVDPRALATLCGPEIPLIYDAQQGVELRQPCGWGIGERDMSNLDMTKPIARGYTPVSGGNVFIQIKPLDDPDNPYREYYGEWDRAFYEFQEMLCRDYEFNERMESDDFRPSDMSDLLLGTEYSSSNGEYWERKLSVDDNGYLIPQVLYLEMLCCGESHNYPQIIDEIDRLTLLNFRVYSIQPRDDELCSASSQAEYCMMAKYIQELPAWLAEAPPAYLVLLPTGEIVAHGELGVDIPWQEMSSQRWYRYSENGELLDQTELGKEWWELYFPDFQERLAELGGKEKVSYHQRQGYVRFQFNDPDNYQPPVAFTYKGEKVEYPYNIDDFFAFLGLPGKYIPAMREVQLELK